MTQNYPSPARAWKKEGTVLFFAKPGRGLPGRGMDSAFENQDLGQLIFPELPKVSSYQGK